MPADLAETTFAILVPDDDALLRGIRIEAMSRVLILLKRPPAG